MSLSRRIGNILAPIALVMVAIILGGTLLIVTPSLRRVEDQYNQRMTSHTLSEFTRHIEALDSLVLNHASYESTYDFALDPVKYPTFADVILSDSYFSFKQLSDVFILGNSGELVFGKSYDALAQRQIPFREGTRASLVDMTAASAFSDASVSVSGVIDTPDGCYIVSAHPITGDDPEKAAAGTLVMTRALDDATVSDISEHIGLRVAFYSCLDANLPGNVEKARQALSASADPDTVYSKSIDLNTTAGYTLIHDINGNPALVMQVTIPRDIYHVAVTIVHAYISFTVIFHTASIIGANYLIRRFVISRVKKTADFAAHVSDTNDLSKRLDITGDDEIAHLETSLNCMIDRLEQAQKHLLVKQQNEEEMRRTIESVADAISLLDMNLDIVSCNDAAVMVFGYGSKQEILEKNVMDFVAPDDRARIPELRQQIVEQGRLDIFEVNLLKGNGERFTAEITGAIVKDAGGLPVGFVTSCRDITERKKAETRLKAQYDIIERILAAMPQAVMVVSEKGRIILVNQAFYSIFNIPERDVKGSLLSRYLPVKELEEIISSALAENNASFHVDFGMEISGSKRTYSATAIAMPPQEILLLFTDLTEIREKTEKLFMNDRLASIGELASGVAHELGAPLSSIIMFSELLDQQELPKSAREDVHTINSEAHRSAEIIRDLLAFARKNNADKKNTSVSRILDAVMKLRAHEHKLKNIRVVLNIAPELPDIRVDFTKMEQVFLNLITNAEQSMFAAHQGGTLNITADTVNGWVRIAFTDDGGGIAEENMKHIFDPFFTTKPIGEGTGLGLSICYGIVRQHGGNLSVSSREGSGATFTLELPAAENTSPLE